jgi:hypothetical protein
MRLIGLTVVVALSAILVPLAGERGTRRVSRGSGFWPRPPFLTHKSRVCLRPSGKACVSRARGSGGAQDAARARALERAGAIIILGDTMFFGHRTRIADHALRRRLPTVFGASEYVEVGGLPAYGLARRPAAPPIPPPVTRVAHLHDSLRRRSRRSNCGARAGCEVSQPALREFCAFFAAVRPDGESQEHRRVASEPQQADSERLLPRAERAPRELRVVVGRQERR